MFKLIPQTFVKQLEYFSSSQTVGFFQVYNRPALRKKRIFINIIIISLVLAIVNMSGCSQNQVFKLGFSSALTGRDSSLGKDIFEGATLAVDDIARSNLKITIELVVLDDGNEIPRALENNKIFKDQGITTVMGHATSNVAAALIPFWEENEMVFLGATTSSALFDEKDDPIFRIISSTKSEARIIAQATYDRWGSQRVAIIYNKGNLAYSQPWYEVFIQWYTSLGGQVTQPQGFEPGSGTLDSQRLVTQVLQENPDIQGLVIIASPLDSAQIAQSFRRQKPDGFLITAGWANNQDIITFGGEAVEGLLTSEMFSARDESSQYVSFKLRYQERFGKDPSFASVNAYETVYYLLAGIEASKPRETIKEGLKRVHSIQGLQDRITFTEFGDASRSYFIMTVENGEFVTIGKVSPE